VPANVRLHQKSSSSDEESCEKSSTSSNEEVDSCARTSHGVLTASPLVYGRTKTAWKYYSSSLVERTSGHDVFTYTTGVSKFRNYSTYDAWKHFIPEVTFSQLSNAPRKWLTEKKRMILTG